MKTNSKKLKRFVSLILTIVMVLTVVPTNAFALQDNNTNSMEITEEHLNANQYETYYYTDEIEYTYNGHKVEFISDSEISANGETISLKNKKTNIGININENDASITFEGLDVPIYQVAGQWNSSYEGDYYIAYNTDIPGQEAIKSATKNLKELVINDLEAGVYHLTGGTIFEKANSYSPGIDGIGKEGNFGTLPDMTITVVESNGNEGEPENPDLSNSIKITDEHLNANKYETYYYVDGANYTYNDQKVEFSSNSEIKVNGETISLKNKKTNININVEENNASISFEGLDVPVFQVSGQWNSTYNGEQYITYNTDIPGKEVVKSANYNLKELAINDLKAGEYHLTGGTIYEKANEWSPGISGIGTEGRFGTLPDITITIESTNQEEDNSDVPDYGPVITEIPDDFENDLWLQYDFKEMKVGDTADLYPRRIPQIVGSSITNDLHRPNFNFEIISGDSISLSTTKTDQKSVVTAEKQGDTIVKVTYDATSYKGYDYGASSEINTAYVVFSVANKETDIEIDTNIAQRSYDTIYFTDKSGIDFNFNVKATNAEKVKVTCNGEVLESENNNYTAKLQNRSNVIGIEATDSNGNVKSYYKVVDARLIEINVENVTTSGKDIYEGDTVKVSFKGISNPVAKLATLYNPTWVSSSYGTKGTFVEYNNDTVGTVKGYCSQWDLATKNSFEVKFDDKGTYTFEGGRIFSEWWGEQLGKDKEVEGLGPNLGAPTREDYFSTMPNFEINVLENENKPEVSVTGVTLDKQSVTLIDDESTTLTAKVQPTGATNKNVVWSSSDNKIVTVKDGKITGVKAGQAVVTVRTEDGDFKAECTVTVKDSKFIELENLITEVERLSEDNYEAAGWKVLVEKLKAAKEVLSDKTSQTQDYILAKEELEKAKNDLVVILWKIVIEPKIITPGDEVTVSLPNMKVPAGTGLPKASLKTVYNFDMPGFDGKVESEEGSKDGDKIKTIKFTVGEDIEPGTYTMSDGYVFLREIMNRPIDTHYYRGQMPNIEIVVSENEAPVINAKDIEIYAEDDFDPMDYATASDREDGDITNKIEIVENTVDTSKVGVYKVVYKVVDSKNVQATKEIKVTVIENTVTPEKQTVKVGVYSDEKAIFESIDVELKKNDTAYTVLKRLLGDKVVSTGENETLYVQGIDGLFEFDKGPMSGWNYAVNKVKPNVSAGAYKLKDGDEMVWHYTLNYGEDIQNSLDKFDEFLKSQGQVQPPVENTAPVINASNKELYVGDEFKPLEGVTATDKEDGDLTSKVVVKENAVDTSKEGVYKVVYEVEDSEGLKTTKEIKVAVIKKVEKVDVASLINNAANWILENTKEPTFGDEWKILGLVRGNIKVSDDYYKTYYNNVVKEVQDKKGELSRNKYTEYSRLIITLTALGYDPTNVGGYNLVEKLNNLDNVSKQGINGVIFALIALDTDNYEVKGSLNSRSMMINYILENQLADGGFALSGDKGEVDITAMALQALANYKSDEKVNAAIEKALTFLSNKQLDTGGFATAEGENLESSAQALVAINALGISAKDERFMKNGNTVVDAMARFAVSTGGYKHVLTETDANSMATEQALYAFVSQMRLNEGYTGLYDMSDLSNEVNPPVDEDDDKDDDQDGDKEQDKEQDKDDDEDTKVPTGQGGDSNNNGGNGTSGNNSNGTSNPQTSDDVAIGYFITISAMSLIALLVLSKRKKIK